MKNFLDEAEDFLYFCLPFFGIMEHAVNPRTGQPIAPPGHPGGTHVADFLCFEWLGCGFTLYKWSKVRKRT